MRRISSGPTPGASGRATGGAEPRAADPVPVGPEPEAPALFTPAAPGTLREAAGAAPALVAPQARAHDVLSRLADALLERPREGGAFAEVPSVREALELLERTRTELGAEWSAAMAPLLAGRSPLHEELQKAFNPRIDVMWVDLEPLLAKLGVHGKVETPFAPIEAAYGEVASRHRYALGDLVAVPLPPGGPATEVAEGIAVRPKKGEGLEVEYRERTGASVRRVVPWKELLAANPMKIGDCIEGVPGMGTVTCEGVDAKGQLRGRVTSDEGTVRPLSAAGLREVAERLAPRFAAQVDPNAPFPADLIARAKTLSAAEVPSEGAFVPSGGSVHHRYVGGKTTPGVVRVETEHVSLAFKTHAGWGYKPWNEDGVVAGVFHVGATEYAYLFVLDEAGDESHVAGRTAAGTEVVADALEKSLARIRDEGISPEVALADFVIEANRAVQALRDRALSEGKLEGSRPPSINVAMVGGIVKDGDEVTFVSEGDAQMVGFSKGKVDIRTYRDNLGDRLVAETGDVNAGVFHTNVLSRSLGSLMPFEKPRIGGENLEGGESLLFCSDGLGDANERAQLAAHRARENLPESLHWNDWPHNSVTVRQLESFFAQANPTPAAAVETLDDFSRRSDESGRGKPDNKTYGVLRTKKPAELAT